MNTTLPYSGDVFDFRYRIACRLGRGADGYVFGATELETGKRVAIKCWVGPHAEQALAAAQQFVRTAHEARLFDNPNILEVLAAEAGSTVSYCVMDWLEGTTLAQRIMRRRPSPLHDVFNIVVPCMRAVAEAHAAGIVHGDIRPGHIFVCQATRHRPSIARVFDFGRGTSGLASMPQLARAASDEASRYATPEQLIGAALDARSDVYAFGVMLFEMLAGELPFVAETSDELARRIKDGTSKLLASISPTIPVRLAHIVERAMAVDPQLRYASLSEMIEALEPFDPTRAEGFVSPAAPAIPALPPHLAAPTMSLPSTTSGHSMPSMSSMSFRAAMAKALPASSPSPKAAPPPPPPASARRTVVSSPPPPAPPPPAAPPPPPPRLAPPEDITTTSASWELTEPIRMRGFVLERLMARLSALGQKRVAVWCLVLMASMIAARAVQRMAAPAFAPEASDTPLRQQASPSSLDLDQPDCYSVVAATDPRCARAPRVPQPTAAPIRPTTVWPLATGSSALGAVVEAADSGMRSPSAVAPTRPAHRAPARTRRVRAFEESKSAGREDRRHDALDDLLDTADEVEGESSAPLRKRSVATPKTERSNRRSRSGEGASRTNDPFERLDRMRLQ